VRWVGLGVEFVCVCVCVFVEADVNRSV